MSQSKPSTPEITEIAGRYEVQNKLGAGAFGTVYKVKDKILGRLLAIKTIRLEGLAAAGTSLEELMQRFKKEAQVSAQLKHPNIVTIYDIGEADGLSYLAMEFIDGLGLEKVIHQEGKLPLERAASIASQVADALDFAHKNNVVHRDIKPANIMIEDGDRVKVTDFGIAKVTNSVDHLTQTGSLLGTPSYMSPEQARGAEIDGRSDLFAVGAVFYEMLAGKKAFRGDSITSLIFKIMTEDPEPIHVIEPSIPESVTQVIAKALAKTPDGRYQSGRELADDLLAFTRQGSMPTMRQAELGTAPFRSGALPTLSGGSPTVHASQSRLATHVSPATAQRAPGAAPPRVSPPPPPRAERAAKSSSNFAIILVMGVLLLGVLGIGAVGAWWFFVRKPAQPQVTQNEPAPTLAAAVPSAPPATAAAAPEPTPPPPSVAAAPTSLPQTLEARTAPTTLAPRSLARETPAPAPAPASVLDDEPSAGGGGDASQRLAQAFRGQDQEPSSYYGTRRRVVRQPLSPPNLSVPERPAVATIRHVMNAEETFKKQSGHYASLPDLKKDRVLFLDVPIQAETFDRRGYHFQLSVSGDSFKLVALPMNPGGGGRAFHGDESGYIAAGVD